MFTIRPEQMLALSEALEDAFVSQLCTLLRRHHPLEASAHDDASLERFARRALERAEKWGLTWQSTRGDFVSLALQIGATFDEHPRVQGLLRDSNEEPNLRVGRLFEELTPDDWQEIRWSLRKTVEA
jgi:hypothetical protein